MVNLVSKLPKSIRNRLKTIIGTGFGLFLALRYNDFIRNTIDRFVPTGNSWATEFVVLVVLTFGIVYFAVFIERILDGGK